MMAGKQHAHGNDRRIIGVRSGKLTISNFLVKALSTFSR